LAAVRLVTDEAGGGWGLKADAEVGPALPESAHPLSAPRDSTLTWRFVHPENATSLAVTFDRETAFASGGLAGDQLSVTDAEGRPVAGSPFSGLQLGGATIVVAGREVRLTLQRNSSSNLLAYGLRITRIEPRFGRPRPVLRTRVFGPYGPVLPATLVSTRVVVENIGAGAAGGFRIGFYWSRTAGATFNRDIPAGSPCPVSFGLERGERAGCNARIEVPERLGDGRWFLVAVADDAGRLTDLDQPEFRFASQDVTVLPLFGGLPESAHPYAAGSDETQTYRLGASPWMRVWFDWRTQFAPGDRLYVTDAEGRNMRGSPFTGRQLANRAVQVFGDTVKLRLVSRSSAGGYGYRVVRVEQMTGLPPTMLLENIEVTEESNAGEAGNPLAVAFRIRSLSGVNSSAGTYRFYFSSSPDAPVNGQFAPEVCDMGDTRGETRTCTGNITVPPCLSPGTYYLMLLAAPPTASDFGPVVGDHLASERPVQIRNGIMTRTRDLPESDHPYAPFTKKAWLYETTGDHVAIDITFDALTRYEPWFDSIFLQGEDGGWLLLNGPRGDELAGVKSRFGGKTACFFLQSDAQNERFGFRVVRATTVEDDEVFGPGISPLAVDKVDGAKTAESSPLRNLAPAR
jgi:hypothetical protein